jgi:hypothetical protein
MKGRVAALIAAGSLWLGLVGCAPPPRPMSLVDTDQMRRTPAALDAATRAPQAHARAEQFRRQSELAWQQGQVAASSVLAERAKVAYEHAQVLARIARAVQLAESASQDLRKTQQELRALEAEQARLVADAEAIELKVKLIKDAEAPAVSTRADPAREAARMAATRAIVADARLLCVCARLVHASAEGLGDAEAELQRIESMIAAGTKAAPIDDARRSRARCLTVLTAARRLAGQPASSGSADIVLAEISARTDLSPVRDDRGVMVVVGGVDPSKIGGTARSQLDLLLAIAQAHPSFPLLVVSRSDGRASEATAAGARARSEAVVRYLIDGGMKPERVRAEVSAAGQPSVGSVKPQGPGAVELVFVSPGT